MLVKPIGRWHEKAIRTPFDSDAGPPFLPKKRIAFARKNHDVRARSVPVTSRVSAGRILLEVGAHCIASQVEPDPRRSLTSQTSISEAKISHVCDKIGLPRPVACDLSSLSVVVAIFAIESVPECKPVAANKIDITETIDHLGGVGERDKAGCLASLCIEVLMPSV